MDPGDAIGTQRCHCQLQILALKEAKLSFLNDPPLLLPQPPNPSVVPVLLVSSWLLSYATNERMCHTQLHVQGCNHSSGATGVTAVAPKFSDTLTLSQPRGADSAHHCRSLS